MSYKMNVFTEVSVDISPEVALDVIKDTLGVLDKDTNEEINFVRKHDALFKVTDTAPKHFETAINKYSIFSNNPNILKVYEAVAVIEDFIKRKDEAKYRKVIGDVCLNNLTESLFDNLNDYEVKTRLGESLTLCAAELFDCFNVLKFANIEEILEYDLCTDDEKLERLKEFLKNKREMETVISSILDYADVYIGTHYELAASKAIELLKERIECIQYQAVDFNKFSKTCPYLVTDTNVNNGFGCRHKSNPVTGKNSKDQNIGSCLCDECPILFRAEEEDYTCDRNLTDWGNISEISEDIALAPVEKFADGEVKVAIAKYNKNISHCNSESF